VGPAVLCIGRMCGALWPAFRGPLCGSLLRRLVVRFLFLFPATHILCLSFTASAAVLSHKTHTHTTRTTPQTTTRSVKRETGHTHTHDKNNTTNDHMKKHPPHLTTIEGAHLLTWGGVRREIGHTHKHTTRTTPQTTTGLTRRLARRLRRGKRETGRVNPGYVGTVSGNVYCGMSE